MGIDAPALPSTEEWRRFGISEVVELQAGHQSRVFAARADGVEVAVKLTDRRFADRAPLETRMAIVERLADDSSEVVAPHRLDRALVQEIGEWLVTATPIVRGDPLDLSRPEAGELMGRALARLHSATAQVPPADLPTVAALRTTTIDCDRAGWQLLHGDFNDQNVISTPSGLRIFDFDDCGYGPTEFDVANSLYMVLFDAEVHDRMPRYERFRRSFPTGYAEASGQPLDDGLVEQLIAERIRTLGGWLDDLSSAPIGIRTSSPDWQDTLRSFVGAHAAPGDVTP